MKLADLRRTAIRKQVRIRFPLSNGMDCVVSEHGIAQMPALAERPQFNLETELEQAARFIVEPVTGGSKQPTARNFTREEMNSYAAGQPAAAVHDDHDE